MKRPTNSNLEAPPMATSHGKKVLVRWMIRRDMAEVLEIEAGSFSDPDNEAEFTKYLRKRENSGYVAEVGEKIVAFMLQSATPDERTVNLDRLAVHPDFRRQGIGGRMVSRLGEHLRSTDSRRMIQVEVDERNLAAQLFFRSCGYLATAVNRRASGSTYVMQYQVKEAEVVHARRRD